MVFPSDLFISYCIVQGTWKSLWWFQVKSWRWEPRVMKCFTGRSRQNLSWNLECLTWNSSQSSWIMSPNQFSLGTFASSSHGGEAEFWTWSLCPRTALSTWRRRARPTTWSMDWTVCWWTVMSSTWTIPRSWNSIYSLTEFPSPPLLTLGQGAPRPDIRSILPTIRLSHLFTVNLPSLETGNSSHHHQLILPGWRKG